MPIEGIRARALAFILVAAASSVSASRAAAAGANPQPDPFLVAEVIVSGGPTFFIRSFEGLGDVALLRRGELREGAAVPRGQLRLIRGFTRDRTWWDWRQQVLGGRARDARHDLTVVLLDQTFAEVARWELKDAWPQSVKVSLDAEGAAREEMVLAHGAISLVNPPPGP